MNTVVSKWGNSLGLRIPRNYADALKLEERSAVELSVEDGALVVRPVAEKKTFDLDTLVAEINSGNIHGEVGVGGSVGNEF